ncbi:RraA family protein [Candidatus Poribacteria bacterium]|nr:RraA family protein [Candidatus Poribacteria bacterium]
MSKKLSPEQLEELKLFDTPTISNAIERFNVRPRSEGFMSPEIKCIFPDLGRMVGYASTATIMAKQPRSEIGGQSVSRHGYWDYIVSVPAPRVAVIQDLDNPPAVGSFWGEVNGNIHKALGCVGTVTNGGVRDLDEVHALGFHFFASAPIVSHAYVHLVQYNVAVEVGGVIINSGDLIHADKHGVIMIPHEIAANLADMCREVQRAERPIISLCKSPDFSLDKLKGN